MQTIYTLRHLSAMKMALDCYNDFHLKNDLCISLMKLCDKRTNGYLNREAWNVYFNFRKHPKIVKKIYHLPQWTQKEVMHSIEIVPKNVVEWCLYHTVKFDLAHSYGFDFLDESMLTSEGDVSYVKAANKIINDETLSTCQRFKVACGYFMTDKIAELWKKISAEDIESFFLSIKQQNSILNHNSNHEYSELIHQSQFPRIWAYYFSGKILQLLSWNVNLPQPTEGDVLRHAVKQSVVDGDVRAVKFAWEQRPVIFKKLFAVEIISQVCNDLMHHRPSYKDEQLIHIFCFLMSNMSDDNNKLLKETLGLTEHLEVLLRLLPHHDDDSKLKIVTSLWDLMSLENYITCLACFDT